LEVMGQRSGARADSPLPSRVTIHPPLSRAGDDGHQVTWCCIQEAARQQRDGTIRFPRQLHAPAGTRNRPVMFAGVIRAALQLYRTNLKSAQVARPPLGGETGGYESAPGSVMIHAIHTPVNCGRWVVIHASLRRTKLIMPRMLHSYLSVPCGPLTIISAGEAVTTARVPTLALTGADDGCIDSRLFDLEVVRAGWGEGELRIERVAGGGHFLHQEVGVDTLVQA
jgi:hypothetical protein